MTFSFDPEYSDDGALDEGKAEIDHSRQEQTQRESAARTPSRPPAQQPLESEAGILGLQRSFGNRAVARSLAATRAGGARPARRVAPQSEPAWRASNDLWYFSGEAHAGPLPTEVSLRAGAPREGHYAWEVLEGHDKVELVTGSDAARAEVNGDNGVQLRSTGASRGVDDVRIGVARLAGDGSVLSSGEGALGVRNPVGTRQVGASTVRTVGAGPGAAARDAAGELPATGREAPAVPHSLRHKGTSHQASASWGYETRITYEALDDTGNPIKGYDVNEQWTTGVVNDDAACNWPRGAPGGLTASGTTFDDLIGAVGAGGTPAPQAPQNPLGTTKEQHWGQDWYIGSTTPGKGTRVQSNTLQKYLDHANHLDVKSPAASHPAPAPGVSPPPPPPPPKSTSTEAE